MLRARVSHVEGLRYWRTDEDACPVDDLIREMTTEWSNEATLRGSAFHRALELADFGEHETLTADGYTFTFDRGEGEVALQPIREIRGWKQIGPVLLTGQSDHFGGRRIGDHKTTSRFDAEKYLAGFSWRAYLTIFGADVFTWHVFEVTETAPQTYRVKPPHTFSAYRYPEMERDVLAEVERFAEFAAAHLPNGPHMGAAAWE